MKPAPIAPGPVAAALTISAGWSYRPGELCHVSEHAPNLLPNNALIASRLRSASAVASASSLLMSLGRSGNSPGNEITETAERSDGCASIRAVRLASSPTSQVHSLQVLRNGSRAWLANGSRQLKRAASPVQLAPPLFSCAKVRPVGRVVTKSSTKQQT